VVLADDGADARTLAARCPHAIVIVAGERVIERTASVLRETAFPRQRVIGLAGEPSAARLRSLLASELRVGPAAVNVLVLGGPGARMIVSAPPGVPKERLDDLVEHVRAADDAGAAPVLTGAAAQAVIDAITADSRRVVVCAAQCSGEYGLDGSVVAVPVVLGTPGIERIVEIELDPAQRDALHAAALA
jgi:malate dehydrogenase